MPRRPRIVLTNIRLRRVVALLAVVAVAGAGFVAVTEQLEHRRHDRATADRAAIVEAAKRGVTYLINIRHDDADADFNRLADISTAPFSDELHSQSANYLQAIRDADVLSTGEVLDAALSVDDGNGTSDPAAVSVIVAANAQVTNTQTHQQEQRSYRFDVEIKRVNGIPKVSSLEFVP